MYAEDEILRINQDALGVGAANAGGEADVGNVVEEVEKQAPIYKAGKWLSRESCGSIFIWCHNVGCRGYCPYSDTSQASKSA